MKAGRSEEAERLFKRELGIRDTKMEPDDLSVANTLSVLGQCIRKGTARGGRGFLQRRSGRRKWGPAAWPLPIRCTRRRCSSCRRCSILFALDQCVREERGLREAEVFLKRELEILNANMKPDHSAIAGTLSALGLCILQERRPVGAEGFFNR